MASLFILIAGVANAQQREKIIGLPCEGCEAVFVGMPAEISAHARIAPASEPGQPMRVTGRVVNADGKHEAGIILYAYQTNKDGVYPPVADAGDSAARRHGKLRAWARSDAQGRYSFDTIRPGSYPNSDVPEHIHLHVIEPGCSSYYIDDILFRDDPKLTPKQIKRMPNRAGNGIAAPRMLNGRWEVTRDIYLGQDIPGYSACQGDRTK